MSLKRLAFRGLQHYWRTNLAAVVGLAIAVATLAGAYNVGESVRKSLRDLAAARLGATQFAVTSTGMFREQLLPHCPMLAFEAIVIHDDNSRRASQVALYAIDERFFQFHQRAMQAPDRNDFLLSDELAKELHASAGDRILVRIPRASAIPTDSLHGRKDDPGRTIRGSMRSTISRTATGEFSLRPQQGPVRAIFVNLRRFQRELELEGKVNLALARSDPRPQIRSAFTLDDVGLRVHDGVIEHTSMILSDEQVSALERADLHAKPVLTYLANTIRVNGRSIPYSTVSAIDLPGMQQGEIVLNEWATRELQPGTGDAVTLEYYVWDPSGKLITKSSEFRYSKTIPIDPAHRRLAPEYPGISDAPTISDWDPPFPFELGRIRKADEDYWNRYRASPKAFLPLADGQRIWRTRYGAVTGLISTASAEQIRLAIDPLSVLSVQDVRGQILSSSQGATDFGEYFLYFSFFLVTAALLLAGMFFRFGIEQRHREISTLRAMGWSVGDVRRLLLFEGLTVAMVGSVAGALGAFAYSKTILYGLKTWWIGAVGTTELHVTISWVTLLMAVAAGLLMAVAMIAGSLRQIGHRAPLAAASSSSRAPIYAGVCAAIAVAMLFAGGAAGFFAAGFLLLLAACLAVFGVLKRRSLPVTGVLHLGVRYASYRPGRAVLCIALIASATFLLVAVEAFRRAGATNDTGFRYIAESAIPISYDPNTVEGKRALGLKVDSRWLSFRLRPGEDASCLNLYQPQNPRVIGAPDSFLKLDSAAAEGEVPAAVDANTLTYVLHKKLGDVVVVGGAKLRIVKSLHDSVFQSEVLIRDSDFQRVFPEEQGRRVFLIDAPEGADAQIEAGLADYGLDVTSVADRLAAFHRVENTYLSTFQALGALGLLLGTAGLAAVGLRNALERRRELALLRAIGYAPQHLRRMIMAESLFVLSAGLAAGAVSAGIAVAPVVLTRGGSAPFWTLFGLLISVLLCGVLSSLLGVQFAARSPLLSELRSE